MSERAKRNITKGVGARKAHRNDWCRGFTLVETVIYVALIALMATSFVTFSLAVSDAGSKSADVSVLQENARIALLIMSSNIREAESVNIASSTFDVDPGELVLIMSLSSKNPTIISLNKDDGVLQITESTSTPVVTTITSSEIVVTNLVFTDLTGSSTRANIRIEISLESVNTSTKAFGFTQSFQTAVSTRK